MPSHLLLSVTERSAKGMFAALPNPGIKQMSRKHRLQENVFISSGKQDVGCQAVQRIAFEPSESPEMRSPKVVS